MLSHNMTTMEKVKACVWHKIASVSLLDSNIPKIGGGSSVIWNGYTYVGNHSQSGKFLRTNFFAVHGHACWLTHTKKITAKIWTSDWRWPPVIIQDYGIISSGSLSSASPSTRWTIDPSHVSTRSKWSISTLSWGNSWPKKHHARWKLATG